MTIVSRAPVRIDFAGAWTDVEFFADTFGGATLNAAIAMYVSGSLHVPDEEDDRILEPPRTVSGPSGKYIVSGHPALKVGYSSVVPAGSGLGTSATMNIVWLSLARRELIANEADRLRIASLSYEIEKTLGIIGGKQDQYASAIGGINLFEFKGGEVARQPVNLTQSQVAELESLLILCYTGKARLSSNIHRQVWGRFKSGNQDVLNALFRLRDSAHEAQESLDTWDLETFARLITEQRHLMRRLDPSTTNTQIEELFELTSHHTMGGKPCGAGGGGCVLFIANDLKAKRKIRDVLRAKGLKGLDLTFDFEGLVLTRE